MTKYFTFFILLFLNFYPSIFANPFVLKGSFVGTITDGKTGMPIQGVSIYFSDIKEGGMTNANGQFSITNIPEGNHLVEISHIGYSSIVENILITENTNKNYSLQVSVIENNAVIVTGVGSATQLKKSPYQVSVLRKEDFAQTASSNIIEALTKKPGIATMATGPAISKPVIRGLGYNRVLTVNDGVRQEGQQWGDEHGIEVDEASVNKIEILKGPASLMYGSDAMAGVINIITNVPVANNTIKANIFSGYQSNNKSKSFNANIAGNLKGFNWNLYQSFVAAADYKNKFDGNVFNSKFNENNFGGYIGYNGNWGFSHLLFSNFNLKAGLVEGDRDTAGFFIKPIAGGNVARATDGDFKSTTPLIPYQHIQHFKIATDNNIMLGKNHLSLNIGFQQNQRQEFGNVDTPSQRALFFDLKTITYTAQLHFKEINGWKSVIGLNGMKQFNTNKGVEQLIPDYNLFDIGTYVYTQKSIKNISISGGIRYDSRTLHTSNLMNDLAVKSTGFNKMFSNISGSVGLTDALSKLINVKLNIARGFRAPSVSELASNGAHEGTIRYEYGNQQLKSETSTQIDAGFEFTTEHVSINLSGYYNSINNFIFYRKLQTSVGADSTINIAGQNLAAFKFQQQSAILKGIEATIDFHPHPLDWLHIQNSFSIESGKFIQPISGSTYLPFMPAPRWVTEIKVEDKKCTKNIQNAYAKLELDNTFTQNKIFAAYNTETITKGYSLLNAGFGTDVLSNKNTLLFKINFAAMNLADVAYQNHLSRLKYAAQNLATGRIGVFNMGRNFSLKINIPINFSVKPKF